ncbi:hypothetical protein D0Z03_000402 [Geotrichum reessii]|nr:hypothetical protein D0Z03_000402 [Galactomyces reessii]
MQNAETLVKQRIENADVSDGYNFESELELLDDGTELANAVKYVVDNNDEAKTLVSESVTSGDDSEKQVSCDSEASSKLFSDGLAKRAEVVRMKVRKRIESIMQNYDHYTEIESEIREKMIKLYYLDSTLETVLSKYNRLKQKFYPRSFGVYYPPTPKNESGEAEKGLASGGGVKQGSESAELVESPAEAETISRTMSPTAVQDYVEQGNSGLTSSEFYKQREREEGDFHKLGVFIRHTKSEQSLTQPLDASGSQLRQLLLNESGVTCSEDIESFINRLRDMDDAELQAYFRRIYGKKLTEDNSPDGSASDNDERVLTQLKSS